MSRVLGWLEVTQGRLLQFFVGTVKEVGALIKSFLVGWILERGEKLKVFSLSAALHGVHALLFVSGYWTQLTAEPLPQ